MKRVFLAFLASLTLANETAATAEIVEGPFTFSTDSSSLKLVHYSDPGGVATIPNMVNGLPVVAIGQYVFGFCRQLTGVTIPVSVTNISEQAFYGCATLVFITVDDGNQCYSGVDGVLFNKSQTTLVSYPAGRVATAYTVPHTVTNIAPLAFYECISLTSVTVLGSVTTVGHGVFAFNNSLKEVYFHGNAPTFVGSGVFNTSLNATVYYFPGRAGWSSTFADRPAVMLEYAYDMHDSAVSITGFWCAGGTASIPNQIQGLPVTWIENSAFAYCTSLTNVTIPDTVTKIADNAFFGCTRLTSVTIPDSVTTIGANAFSFCTGLRSITIPSSVTDIGGLAFFGCTTLSEIFFNGNAPTVGPYLFTYAGPVVYYRAGTTGWGTTFADCPTAIWGQPLQASDPNVGVTGNQFGFTITGSDSLVIVLDACTDLSNPSWVPVATNALADGSAYFSDAEWTNHPARFYRIRSP